ncbi:hydrogenase maturation nickel metallochaperone HypA [Pseudodesulfovibrio karagichevae]
MQVRLSSALKEGVLFLKQKYVLSKTGQIILSVHRVIDSSNKRQLHEINNWKVSAMHETAIILSTISIVEEEAKKRGVSQIHSVTMCVGELACVEEQTLRGCFEVAVETSTLSGAELIIKPVEAVFCCGSCGASNRGRTWSDTCPRCKAANLTLTQGRELYVKSFEAD